MTEPHPQRCDTCKHYQPYQRYTGDCKILDHWLKTGEYELIAKVGCASHSSQPVPDDSEQFIITGFQLKQLQDHADLDFVCQAIRHHPILEDWTRVLNDAWMQERDERIKAEAAKAERERVLDEVIHDVERMIDAEQERTVDGEYTKDGITKLGILAYVSEHFKSLRGGELG